MKKMIKDYFRFMIYDLYVSIYCIFSAIIPIHNLKVMGKINRMITGGSSSNNDIKQKYKLHFMFHIIKYLETFMSLIGASSLMIIISLVPKGNRILYNAIHEK